MKSFTSLLVYCHFFLQNIEDMTNNAYPKMINLERGQKLLKTYTSFLFEARQEAHSIYCLLNNTKLKFYSFESLNQTHSK